MVARREVAVRRRQPETARAHRRILRAAYDRASFVGRLDVADHDAARSGIEDAGDEVVEVLGEAHDRDDLGRLEPRDQVGDALDAEPAVFHVNHDVVEVGVRDDLGDAARAEFHEDLAERDATGGERLVNASRFHERSSAWANPNAVAGVSHSIARRAASSGTTRSNQARTCA